MQFDQFPAIEFSPPFTRTLTVRVIEKRQPYSSTERVVLSASAASVRAESASGRKLVSGHSRTEAGDQVLESH